MGTGKTPDTSLLSAWIRLFTSVLNYFGVTKENYPDIRARTDAATVMTIALAYTCCWVGYFFIYGFAFNSRMIAAICLFPGLPTALLGLYYLKKKRDVNTSSFWANSGGVTTVLLITILTGGAWSHQIVWCIAGVLATFLIQSARAGVLLAVFVSSCLALISFGFQPHEGDVVGWDFPFPIFSGNHAIFNALTQFSGVLLVAVLAFTFKNRQAAALRESEKLREEAEEARRRAEHLTEQVEEHTRNIRSMLENTRLGLFSVLPDMLVHRDYARYLETILELKDIGGKTLDGVLLQRAELGPDEKNRIVTAMEYSLGENELFFEANASAFPRELTLALPQQQKKNLDIDWVPVVDRDGNVEKILISVVDVTENLKLRAEAEATRRNMRCMAELIELGPKRFESFSQSASETWRSLDEIFARAQSQGSFGESDIREAYIHLHTLKGAARLFKLKELTDHIHSTEDILHRKKSLSAEEVSRLTASLGHCKESHQAYKEALKPLINLAQQLREQGESDSTSVQGLCRDLQTVAHQLAEDLGKIKCPLVVEVPQDLVLQPAFFKALSDSMIHLLRNSLDHGIQPPEERRSKGLSEHGSIRIFQDAQGRLALQDDGRGLPLAKLREKAQSLGRKVGSTQELVEMIFESGVSTKQAADDISGRGVGMDAVRSFLRKAGSDIIVVPLKEEGDYLSFYFAIPLPKVVPELTRKAS